MSIINLLKSGEIKFTDKWEIHNPDYNSGEMSFSAPKELVMDNIDSFILGDYNKEDIVESEIQIAITCGIGFLSTTDISLENVGSLMDKGFIECYYGPLVRVEDGDEVIDLNPIDLTDEDVRMLLLLCKEHTSDKPLTNDELILILKFRGYGVVSPEDMEEIKSAYESNKETLQSISEVEDPETSFEQGYNNALEFTINKIKGKE